MCIESQAQQRGGAVRLEAHLLHAASRAVAKQGAFMERRLLLQQAEPFDHVSVARGLVE